MVNLEQYKNYFDRAYPAYADSEYSEIRKLVDALPNSPKASSVFSSSDAQAALNFILPLIKIKNYKSQIPFPEGIYEASELLIEIKNDDYSKNLAENDLHCFGRLLDVRGFQLPTVSAVFHFCHPAKFPIVDRNIEAACVLLSKDSPDESDEVSAPALPASTTSVKNKLSKYKAFIQFLDNVIKIHNQEHKTQYGYRELDKALMVYGVKSFKLAAEDYNKTV